MALISAIIYFFYDVEPDIILKINVVNARATCYILIRI